MWCLSLRVKWNKSARLLYLLKARQKLNSSCLFFLTLKLFLSVFQRFFLDRKKNYTWLPYTKNFWNIYSSHFSKVGIKKNINSESNTENLFYVKLLISNLVMFMKYPQECRMRKTDCIIKLSYSYITKKAESE